MNRPTTTQRPTTQRPTFDYTNNNKPYYQYPSTQNEWNYETNQIQHGPISSSAYPTYHSPVSSSHHSQNNHKPQNTYNNYNYGGYVDDSGYTVTPSPSISNNDYNRPQATPQRPLAPQGYQQPDYDEGFNYGSYQGIENHLMQTHLTNAPSTTRTLPPNRNSHCNIFWRGN